MKTTDVEAVASAIHYDAQRMVWVTQDGRAMCQTHAAIQPCGFCARQAVQ